MKKLLKVVFLIMIVSCVPTLFSGCVKEPVVTEGEFPIYLEYEMNGERYVIEDVVVCNFKKIDTTSIRPSRWYSASLKYKSKRTIISFEENTESKLTKGRINEESSVLLCIGDGGYYLGDPDEKDRGPYIGYHEVYKTEPKVTHNRITKLTNEQLEEIFGIKIIKFEFSEPIENTFE